MAANKNYPDSNLELSRKVSNRSMEPKKNYPGIIITTCSLILAFIFVIPLIWMLFVSFRHEGDVIKNVLSWFKPPYTLETYPKILRTSGMIRWILNSLGIATVSTIATVTVSAMAAYALSKIGGKYSRHVLIFIMFGLMLPGEATIIPLYQIVRHLKLLDSYAGIILPMIASPMAVIILKGFFDGVPQELMDSALIDGCGLFRSFISIVLPLAKPALASIAILTFIGSWNNFLWPFLCVTSDTLYTIPLGIPIFNSNYTNGYVLPMTVNAIASIPVIIVFIIFEKQIIKGVTMTGIKG